MSEKKVTDGEGNPGPHRSAEAEQRKRAIFDSMSPRRRKHLQRKGYDQWDPFIEPNDPIDLRRNRIEQTSQALVRQFLQARGFSEYSNEYGRGALDMCVGLNNNEARYKGMFDFSCWYQAVLKREGK